MSCPIKIGIVDDNKDFCQLLHNYFNDQPEIEVIATAHNGIEAIKILSENKFDVLLLDLIMPQMDGFGVLEWLRENPEIQVKVIVFSAFAQEDIARKAVALGVNYYVLKPFDLKVLTQRIIEINASPVRSIINPTKSVNSFGLSQNDLEAEVTRIIQNLNIPAHFKGYAYLRRAIVLTVNDPSLINEVTKKLYPLIAEYYNTHHLRVERSMRFAIETAWNKGEVQTLHDLFGYCVDDRKGKPTNASFIAKISDKIRLEKYNAV